MRELELLAPARNIEIGIAAIDCGADAVYLAGPAFGARQAAGNSVEDIRRLCEYAHRFGVRVFVTLNTIIFEDELDEAYALALAMQEAGADALIVQDFALPAFEQRHPEELTIPLHASTQCSIRTVEEARRMDALGFSRIVLERELPLSRVREICSAVSCEVEAFVHGALCVCYSGQCYLSEMLSGRSANRGECVQACRSRYDLVNGRGEPVRWPELPHSLTGEEARTAAGYRPGKPVAEDRTLLSLRDLNLLERLSEMAEAGVDSFKIEGRLKSISYVRNIVAAYSQALDRLVDANPGRYCRASFGHSVCGFTPSPAKSFNRGFTQIFFDGRRGQWACLDAGKALGEEVGTVAAVSRTRNGVKITVKALQDTATSTRTLTRAATNTRTLTRAATSTRTLTKNLPPAKGGNFPAEPVPIRFHNGDGFSFIGKDGKEHGFRADVCEDKTILCRVADGIAPGMRLYRNLDTAFEKELETGGTRRIGVNLAVDIKETGCRTKSLSEGTDIRNFRVIVRAVSEDGREIQHVTEIKAEPARNRERMLGMISGQLGKDTGIYDFSVKDIHVDGDVTCDLRISGSDTGDFDTRAIGSSHGLDSTRGTAADNGNIPMISTAQLNAIRRSLAGELDRLPCNARPLNRAIIKGYLPEALKFPEHISYKSDVANSLAADLYRSLGAETVEPAYEAMNRGLWKAEHSDAASAAYNEATKDMEQHGGIELMRSKYCILNELGLCRKTPAYTALTSANDLRSGLFLRNNGRLLSLHFDCKNCEMVVSR